MSVLSQLHFVRPAWFFALLPLGLLVWYLVRKRLTAATWRKACDAHLLPFILVQDATSSGRWAVYWVGIAGMITIGALAGPAWERLPQPLLRDETGLVIALDLSRSMDAVDIPPSRIVRARFKIDDFLARQQGGQVALLAYSDQAFPIVPLTHDVAAVRTFLQSVDTSLMPSHGSRPDVALREAAKLIQRAGLTQGRVLLIADFADERAIAQARHLADENFQIAVLGVGTLQGAPVFLPSGNILKDHGKTVIPRLQESALQRLAAAGRGIYRRLNSLYDSDVNALVKWSQARWRAADDTSQTERTTAIWHDQGAWLILLLLPLALACFRRGVLVVTGAFFLTSLPGEAFAWQHFWSNPDQRGVHLLDAGDASAAAQTFTDPRWKAVAQYRSRNFAAAAETLAVLQRADDFYNKGNALAGAGNFQAALEAYDQALEIDQQMEDAVYNRQIIEQMLQQRQASRAEQDKDTESSEDTGHGESAGQASQARQSRDGAQPTLDGTSEPDAAKHTRGDQDADAPAQPESSAAGSPAPAAQTMPEHEQALEQLLQGVQDDSRRLLQRKFRQLQQSRSKGARHESQSVTSW